MSNFYGNTKFLWQHHKFYGVAIEIWHLYRGSLMFDTLVCLRTILSLDYTKFLGRRVMDDILELTNLSSRPVSP